jgi:cytochrome c oxidase subunit I+III
VNHRCIGLLYIGTALAFMLVGGVLALLLRAQLAVPDGNLLSVFAYNQFFTMHGTVMMFLFAVPAAQGVAIYLLPAMLGARELPFPRLAAYAYWLYATGGVLLCATLFFGVAPDGGWTMIAPLSGYQYSPALNVDLWLAGVLVMTIAAVAGSIQLLVALLRTRAPGMWLARMPVYAWSVLVASALAVLAFAPLMLAAALMALERCFHWPYFIGEKGGDPLLWQQLVGLFGHPLAIVVFLPAAGLVSTMVPALSRTRLVGYGWIVTALFAAGGTGVLAWVAQLVPDALGTAFDASALAALALAVPGAIHVSAWLATFMRGHARVTVPTLYVLGFVFCFVLGGLGGALLAAGGLDMQAKGSYFVVAHLHYMLVGGLVFPLVAALYYWAPLSSGRRLSEVLGRCSFALMFVGLHLAFMPMFVLGLAGMPRRVHTYAGGLGWDLWNAWASAGAFVLALGTGLVLLDLVLHLRVRHEVDADPWHAPGLEWLPRHEHGINSIPEVQGRYPLWDHAGLREEVERGSHFLPAGANRVPQTFITSAMAARAEYAVAPPGPSWLPIVAAVATAAAAYLLALKLHVAGGAAGMLALAAALTWVWGCDRRISSAHVGKEAVPLPVASKAKGRAHSRWATLLVLAVDACVYLSLVAAYIRLASTGRSPWPPLEQPLPILNSGAGAVILWVTSSALLSYAGSALGASVRMLAALVAAFAFNVAALMLVGYGFVAAGLSPQTHAYAAVLAAVLGYQALHAAVLMVLVAYLCARTLACLVDPVQRTSFDNVRLFFQYTVAQGVASAVLLYLFPRLVG